MKNVVRKIHEICNDSEDSCRDLVEATPPFEMLVSYRITTRCQNPEDHDLEKKHLFNNGPMYLLRERLVCDFW
jgi:hypothetical protein